MHDARHGGLDIDPETSAKKLERCEKARSREHGIGGADEHSCVGEVQDVRGNEAKVGFADDLAREPDGMARRTTAVERSGAAHESMVDEARKSGQIPPP